MRADLTAIDVLEFCFASSDGDQPNGVEPGLAGCIGELLPVIARNSPTHGDRRVAIALISIAVELAAETRDNRRVAVLLQNCARILELDDVSFPPDPKLLVFPTHRAGT